MTKRTPMQETFLRVLFAEANGDLKLAKEMAGYAPGSSVEQVIEGMAEDIIEITKQFLALNAPKAAMKLTSLVDEPAVPAAQTLLAACKEILDRTGVVKPEKLQIEGKISGGLFILPAKQED